MTTAFIVLRTSSQPVWYEAYKCIRSIYDHPIIIIDRDNNPVRDTTLKNTVVIKSNGTDGHRLLPLIYLYKSRLFSRGVILTDTMFLKQKIDLNTDASIWLDRHDNQETDLETELLSLLGDEGLITFYRSGRWVSSYMSCYSLSRKSLVSVVGKIPLFSLLPVIRNERYAVAMDRVLSCILQYYQVIGKASLLGDIHHHKGYGNYSIGEYGLGMIPDHPIVHVWGLEENMVTEFPYLTETHVKTLVGDAQRLCLFANFNKNDMQENTIAYINNLASIYDRVIVIANDHKVNNILSLDPRVKVVHFPNKNYDFGLWSRVMKNLEVIGLEEVALVNDSCNIIRSLAPMVQSIRASTAEFVGLTDNHDINYHIQSYFLVFKGYKSIDRLKSFFESKDMNIDYDYSSTVRTFEVSLTSYMREVVSIGVLYKADDIYMLRTSSSGICNKEISSHHLNSAWMLWDVLIVLGCPLIKKKRFRTLISDDRFKMLTEKYGDKNFITE